MWTADTTSSTGNSDAFIRKYNSAGELQWTKQFGTSTGDAANGIAIDPSGNFLLAANQDSDNIVTFRIDPKSGRLSKVGATEGVISPVSLAFLETQ